MSTPSLIRPFTGFVPAAHYAPRIVGPPSSLLTHEQKATSREDELSFRHSVGRGARVSQSAAVAWLDRCRALDALQAVEAAVLVHRLTRDSFSATGIIADVSLDAYDTGRVKRHEATIAKTQAKMLEYMQTTRVYGNPVALGHRDEPQLAHALGQHTSRDPDISFQAMDGASHSLWIVTGDQAQALCDRLGDVVYITDGHHRLAAASALAAAEGRVSPYLPAALFAESELTLGAFARRVDDDTVVAADLISWLEARFTLEEVAAELPRPTARHQIGMRIAGRSFLLAVPPADIPLDAYDRLDVNLLQDLVLEPMLGISNPRTDERLKFVADTVLADHDVDSSTAWFLPYPTSVPDVMTVADSGRAMPPKSTYFMPKVPSGLAIRPVEHP